MSSVIYFRLSSATAAQMEPVQFTGHQLRLLDLKRAIVEQKKMSSAMDFDLKITDAEDKNKGTVLDALYSPALSLTKHLHCVSRVQFTVGTTRLSPRTPLWW